MVKVGPEASLRFEAGCDPGRAWELNVYADNKLLEKRVVEGKGSGRHWEELHVDLQEFSGRTVQLRLYQRVLVANRVSGHAYWRNLRLDGER
jgi:hypothetical protein